MMFCFIVAGQPRQGHPTANGRGCVAGGVWRRRRAAGPHFSDQRPGPEGAAGGRAAAGVNGCGVWKEAW